MKKSIYASLMGMGIVAILLTMFATLWLYYSGIRTESELHLRQMTQVLADGMEKEENPKEWLNLTVQDLEHSIRLTWIDKEGTVRYESAYRLGEMDNHLFRPEIQEALTMGEGLGRRDSQTLDRATSYYAIRLADGSVLRGAVDRTSMFTMMKHALPGVLAVLIVMVILCFFLARMLTRYLVQPLIVTGEMISSVIEGKRVPLRIGVPELDPILARAREQQNHIGNYILQLRKERNTTRLMMNTLKEGIILVDGKGAIVDFNRAAKKIFNLSNEYRGEDLSIVDPDAQWLEKLSEKEGKKKVKSRMHKDDRIYRIIVRRTDPINEQQGMVVVVRDVTADQLAEQQRREFSSNVSHELNTPLTSIRGFAELLYNGMYDGPDEVRNFAERMMKESDRLLGLIQNVMRLSKIEETTVNETWEQVSLNDVAVRAKELLEPHLEKKKVTMEIEGDSGFVYGDAQLLFELILNLADNAIKYNVEGGKVTISIEEDKEKVRLRVKDTGIGIPEDRQGHVFERFYRVESSRSKETGGTGIGLAIVKHIVQRHGGKLNLVSKTDEGTEITVTLPAYEIALIDNDTNQ